MRASARRTGVVLAITGSLATGCGEEANERRQPRERPDRAVDPPPGWRTVRNPRAGFTIAAPRSWGTRTRRGNTVIRSGDRSVAVTLAADRSGAGRRGSAASYAREILAALPGFEGSTSPGAGRVAGSPYRTAVVRATGTVKTSRAAQRITVAVLRRPRRVTYSAVAFSEPSADEAVLLRMLGTLRGRPPARRRSDQRSGRSGYRSSIVVRAR